MFHSRYHLPLFVLCAPFIGEVLSQISNRKTSFLIGLFLLLCALPWVFKNQSRPILAEKNIFNTQRVTQYFTNRPSFTQPYIKTYEFIKATGCSRIGIDFGGDAWEYPFWVLFSKDKNSSYRFEHILVSNVSSKIQYPLGAFDPCIMIDFNNDKKIRSNVENKAFIKVRKFNFISVFIKDNTGKIEKKNLINHFNNCMYYMHKIFLGVMTKKDSAMLQIKINGLKEAELVDIQRLNQIYPELGDKFQRYLLSGLRLNLAGYAKRDKQKAIHGQRLLGEWLQWYEENKVFIKNLK